MRYLVKVTVFTVMLMASLHLCVSAGTVDMASLSPAQVSLSPWGSHQISFSALNDKGFDLSNYSIRINFGAGLTISNINTWPVAMDVTINTKKNYIDLEWGDISSGIELKATFNISADVGSYNLIPDQSSFSDYNGNNYSGSCNSVDISITPDTTPPFSPVNIQSSESNGSISVSWDIPLGTDNAPLDQDVIAYRVYRRTAASTYDPQNYNETTGLSYQDMNANAGTPYYYVVAALDSSGNVSDFSYETKSVIHDTLLSIFDLTDRLYDSDAIVSTGDLNGDNVPDLIVGLPNSGVRKNRCGKVDIFLGGQSTTEPSLTLLGEQSGSKFGEAIAVVDMNNDGFDEIVIGAPGYDAEKSNPAGTAYDAGKFYIYQGDTQLSDVPVYSYEGRYATDGSGGIFLMAEELGSAVASLGDIDSDGYNDVAVTAPLGGVNRSGSIFILFGGSNIVGRSTKIVGASVDDYMGGSIAAAGDVNADGYIDIITGSPLENKAFLIYGGPAPSLSGVVFSKPAYSFGQAVGGADLNGDGYSDIAVASNSYLYIYLGASSVDTSPGETFNIATEFIENLGDLKGNGPQDLLVAGLKLIWGSTSENYMESNSFHGQVNGFGDWNGDGLPDAISRRSDELVYINTLAPYLTSPHIIVDSPQNYSSSTEPLIDIAGSVLGDVVSFTIDGDLITLSPDNSYTHQIPLKPGSNIIELIAESSDGYLAKQTWNITASLPQLTVEIKSTQNLGGDIFKVMGDISYDGASVSVNGISAAVTGNTFTADVELQSPTVTITAAASDNHNRTASHSIDAFLAAGTDSAVSGTITSYPDGALEGVSVTLEDAIGSSTTVSTDTSGKYIVSTQNPGEYTLSVAKSGFFPRTSTGTLAAGQTVFFDAMLNVMPTLSLSITSPQEGQYINDSQASVSGNVTIYESVVVKVNGITAQFTEEAFNTIVPLVEGQNTISATASDQWGNTATDSVNVTVEYPPPQLSFSANPDNIIAGDTATLTWDTTHAHTVSIDNGIGEVTLDGTMVVTPQTSTTYTITATGYGGTDTSSATVTVTIPAPVITFQASPGIINSGESTTLTWNVAYADNVSIDNGIGSVAAADSLVVTPSVPTTYSITATGPGGTTVDSINVYFIPEVTSFVAEPENIETGDATTISWQTNYANNVMIAKNGSAPSYDSADGSAPFTLSVNTRFTLYAEGDGGSSPVYYIDVFVWTDAPPWVALDATPMNLQAGESTTLSWDSRYADSVAITPDIGTVAASGTTSVSPQETTTYTITGSDSVHGSVSKFVTVTVTGAPEATLQATPETIVFGASTTLSWTTLRADDISIDNGVGTVSKNGSISVSPLQTTTYTLTATGSDGTITKNVTVNVIPLPTIDLNVDRTDISAGDAISLTWSTTNADTCSIAPDIGPVATSGSYQAAPPQTTIYTLTATGPAGTVASSVVVNVHEAPAVEITADTISIESGQTALLSWFSSNATSCVLGPDFGQVMLAGSVAVSPAENTLYKITAHGPASSSSAYIRIYVQTENGYGNPTAQEQAHLEAINRARLDPVAEAARLGIDLNEGLAPDTISANPKPPLTFSSQLLKAARLHAQDMIDGEFFAHDSLDGRSTNDRISDTGYSYLVNGENIGLIYNTDPENESGTILSFQDQLFIDAGVPGRGHRLNILRDDVKETGLGMSRGIFDGYPHSAAFTCDFASSAIEPRAFLTGVVFDDLNEDGLYTPGEGVANVEILIIETGESTHSASAGGYRLPLDPGSYTIQASFPDGRIDTQAITIADQNAKIDFAMIPLPVISFSAEPVVFQSGETVDLNWSTTFADTCAIDQNIGNVSINGSTTVSPTQSTVYTLTATGPGGTSTASVDVVLQAPVVTFTAVPKGIQSGETATLSWTTTAADTCDIDQGIGGVGLNGSIDVTPTVSTAYTLTATGAGGVTSQTVIVWIDTDTPVILETTPINNASLTVQEGALSFSVSVSDNESGVCSVTLLDDQGTDISHLIIFDGTSVQWTEANPGSGPLAYTLILEDCAGNAVSSDLTFTLSVVPEDIDYGIDPVVASGADFAGNIRITNGNVVMAREDFSFATPYQHGLGFGAVYNSRSEVQGDLGTGWSHTYSAKLFPVVAIGGQSHLKIIDETGRAAYFILNVGIYEGAFNERSHVKSEGGEYVWYRMDGSRAGFSTTGYLTWLEDSVGNRQQITYSSGLIDTVTDTASTRMLIFHYDGDGQIESIEGPATTAVPDGTWVSFVYDFYQNLSQVIYADGSGYSYRYYDAADAHNLTAIEDNLGRSLKGWSYDFNDRVYQSQDVNGTGVYIDYVATDLVEVTDAYGTLRSYTITGINGRKKATALSGITNAPYHKSPAVRWEYDAELNLIEVEYAGGTSVSPMNTIDRFQDFDANGNARTVINAWNTPDERLVGFTYHPFTNAVLTRTETSVLAGPGQKETIYDYDDPATGDPAAYNENPTRHLYRIIEKGFTLDNGGNIIPYEYITAYTYNGKGQVLTIDGPLAGTSDTTTFDYDPVTGDLLSVDRPHIGSTLFSNYDAAGNVGMVTDVNGYDKIFAYDGRARVTIITDQANGSQTAMVFNSAGQLGSKTDPDGVMQSFTYNADTSRLERISDHQSNDIVYFYDTQGNRNEQWTYTATSTVTARSYWSYNHPDMPGKLYQSFVPNPDDPDNSNKDVFTQYGYDLAGNLNNVTDAKGKATVYEYDALNRVVEILQPGNMATYQEYDSHGNLSRVTDAGNHDTLYGYDDMARVVTVTSQDTGTTEYSYDAAGNIEYKTDANGIMVQYSHDDLYRLTRIDYPAHNSRPAYSVTYEFDGGISGKARLTGMTDLSGSTTFDYSGYDASGIIDKTTVINGQSYGTLEMYTAAGRLSSITYPSGRSVDYDRSGCVCSISGVTTTYSAVTTTLMANLSYRPFGAVDTMQIGEYATADNVNNRYDAAGRLATANPGTANERLYGYDANGNKSSVTMSNMWWMGSQYGYDDLNRLTSASGPFGKMAYTYDGVGNRLTRTINGKTDVYTYGVAGDNSSNRLEKITLSGGEEINYGYDPSGNTTTIGERTLTYGQNNRLVMVEDTTNGVLGEYVYNALGQRVIKTAGGVSTFYHYDMDSKLIAETPSNGSITDGAEYLYKGKSLLAKTDIASGAIYTYHTDNLGKPQYMTDASGNIVWEAIYKPFGEAMVSAGAIVENNVRFPGQYFDAETGWHYNFHRYYDPETGRYLRADPIGLEGGINLFVYTENDPINHIDPLGLEGFNINLLEHEFAGGHTIKLHVAKKISFLRNRIQKDPSTDTASSFYSLRKAQALINMVLNENSAVIEEMMCLQDKGWATIQATFNKPTGYTFSKGHRKSRQVYNVFVLVRKPAATKEGFVVWTAFPY